MAGDEYFYDVPRTNEQVRQLVEANSARLAVSISEGEAEIKDPNVPFVTIDQLLPRPEND